jgi:glutamine phosphoribosylpyrophosphate amidotransferase
MCGITGISRVDERSSINDPRSFMRLAALAIEQRGKHATGFGWTRREGVDDQPMTWYWKRPGPAHERAREAPLEANIATAIGHTRYATQGDVKDNRNNHPVVDGGIVLVHNGIIHNHEKLYDRFDEFHVPTADVDSQVVATLLANLDEMGLDHPVELLKLIEGSAALAWLDTADTASLHLARLTQRPLTIGWTRRNDLVMSSTPETMANLASWSNTRIRDIEEVAEGTYLRVVEGEIVEIGCFEPKRYTPKHTSKYTPHPRPMVPSAATRPTDAEEEKRGLSLAYLLRRDAERSDRLFDDEDDRGDGIDLDDCIDLDDYSAWSGADGEALTIREFNELVARQGQVG